MNKKVISIIAIIALVAILATCLVACNADSYAKKLEKKDYVVEYAEFSEEEAEEFGIEWSLTGIKISLTGGSEFVQVTKFAKAEDAKAAVEDIPEKYADNYKLSGSILVFGTEQGVKDAQ